jgi:hypothetical protein
MRVALINHSSSLTEDDMEAMAEALDLQANQHWRAPWAEQEVAVEYFADARAAPTDMDQIVFFDHSDQAGALGYHSETPHGKPYAKVFVRPILDNGGATVNAPAGRDTVSATASHELLELLGDPGCEQWVEGPAIDQGASYAQELCDPVEAQCYDVTLSDGRTRVTVSNFVLPDWFETQPDSARFDFMGVLTQPFTCAPGGYMQVRGGPGSETDVWGAAAAPADYKRHAKAHHAARGTRRRARHHRPHHPHHGG